MYYISLSKLIKQINDLPVRSVDMVVKFLTTTLYEVNVKAIGRLSIQVHFIEFNIDVNLYREQTYNGLWRNPYVQGATRDVTIEQYLKHVRRAQNREYEDNRFLLSGYSRKYVEYVTSSLRHLRDGKHDAIQRLTRSYDIDIDRYERLVYKIREKESEVRRNDEINGLSSIQVYGRKNRRGKTGCYYTRHRF